MLLDCITPNSEVWEYPRYVFLNMKDADDNGASLTPETMARSFVLNGNPNK